MSRLIPYDFLSVTWEGPFALKVDLPWLSLDLDIESDDKHWVKDACDHLKASPRHQSVQKFLKQLYPLPVGYFDTRGLGDFTCLPSPQNWEMESLGTPLQLYTSLGISEDIVSFLPESWEWDVEDSLEKSQISEELYDPRTFIGCLILQRLHYESGMWTGKGQFENQLLSLRTDDDKFFSVVAHVARNAWYIQKNFSHVTSLASKHFPSEGRRYLKAYSRDELGHHKFMEHVLKELGVKQPQLVPVHPIIKYMIKLYEYVAGSPRTLSSFTTMISIFEGVYYEDVDPLAQMIRSSSKPKAALGFERHYKINKDHRHCDVAVELSQHLAPQPKATLLLAARVYELLIKLLPVLEQDLLKNGVRFKSLLS